MRYLIAIFGALFLVYAAVWLFTSRENVYNPEHWYIPPKAGFDVAPDLPNKEFELKVDEAEGMLKSRINRAGQFRVAYGWFDWLGFATTAILTLIAGVFGMQTNPSSNPGELPKWQMMVVGGLGALASVFAGTSARLQSTVDYQLTAATEIRILINTGYENYSKATNRESALKAIRDLDNGLDKWR